MYLKLTCVGLALSMSLSSCSNDSSSKKKGASGSINTSYNSTYTQPSTYTNPSVSGTGNITITLLNQDVSVTALTVQQGVPVSWTFQAKSLDGSAATITQFSATPTVAGAMPQGSTYSFTPTQASDLSGQLTVYATSATGSTQKQFTWGSGSSGLFGGSSGLGGMMTAFLPTIMGMFTGSGGTTAGGGMGSMFGNLFGGGLGGGLLGGGTSTTTTP